MLPIYYKMNGFVTFFAILVVVLSIAPESHAVRCYVCSWSRNDENNRTDVCTSGNFEPNVAFISDCKLGCETYVQWDVNEVMEQWRRNCIQEETPMTGNCVQDENRARTLRQCTCNSDLCNSAISWAKSSLLLPGLVLLTFVAGFVRVM